MKSEERRRCGMRPFGPRQDLMVSRPRSYGRGYYLAALRARSSEPFNSSQIAAFDIFCNALSAGFVLGFRRTLLAGITSD
jgi:hypothetical protein